MANFTLYFGKGSTTLLKSTEYGTHWFSDFTREDSTNVSIHVSKDDQFVAKFYKHDNGTPFVVVESNERVIAGGYRQAQIFGGVETLGGLKSLYAAIGEAIEKIESAKGGE
jgi:hypothetical protein